MPAAAKRRKALPHETVLIAMLKVYGLASITAHEAFARSPSEDTARRLEILDTCLLELRSALVSLRVHRIRPQPGGREVLLQLDDWAVGDEWVKLDDLRSDYDMRRARERALEAPPL